MEKLDLIFGKQLQVSGIGRLAVFSEVEAPNAVWVAFKRIFPVYLTAIKAEFLLVTGGHWPPNYVGHLQLIDPLLSQEVVENSLHVL